MCEHHELDEAFERLYSKWSSMPDGFAEILIIESSDDYEDEKFPM